jgi:hypothetical protein
MVVAQQARVSDRVGAAVATALDMIDRVRTLAAAWHDVRKPSIAKRRDLSVFQCFDL